MMLFGLGRGIFIFPYLLLYELFQAKSDGTAVNIWYGLTSLGNVLGFMFVSWLLNHRGFLWTSSLLILASIYLISALLTYIIVPEKIK